MNRTNAAVASPAVTVNARFVRQAFTGVQRYCSELVRRLPIASLVAPAPPLAAYEGLDVHLTTQGAAMPGHLWEQVVLPGALPRRALLWSPAGSGPLAVANQVLTIHDVAHLTHPEWYSRPFTAWYRLLLPLLSRRVRRILTVSEFSRRQILRVLRPAPERVVAVPLGVDRRFRRKPAAELATRLQQLGVEEPYLLAVAAVSPRKNFRRLYETWRGLAGSLDGVSLVVVGKTGLAFSGDASRGTLPVRTRVFEQVADEDLVDLYNGALAFVYPSLYEGFGLPVLEAMACGTPVVTADRTSLPEAAGDAAILVDPYNTDAIGRGIRRVIEDAPLREDLRRRGLARAATFTWERTAAQTWKVLQAAAEPRPAADASALLPLDARQRR
ncbi:MAG: glycosyltransferase family 4 protein [Dehalococcoidia bacterium]